MADETIVGKLVVTEKIGVGLEEPIAQLHIAAAASSRIFLESGGSLLKVSVDGTTATIGTDAGTGVPLALQTDGTNRLTITSSGNTTFMGPLTVQNTLTVNGNVGIGTAASPTAKLQVNGVVAATSFQGDASGLTGLQIAAGSITNIQLEDNAVTAAKIQDGSVGQAELAVNSVVEAKLASSAVTEPKLANNAVSSLKLAAGAVLTDKLADSAVTTTKLAAGSVTLDKLDAAAKPAGSQWVSGTGGAIAYTGGKVGIGTNNPPQQLTITDGLGFANQNAVDKKLYSPFDGLLEWMTHDYAPEHGFAVSHQGARRVYLNTAGNSYLNGGNVGIGTAKPVATLDVNGDIKIKGSAPFHIRQYSFAQGSVNTGYPVNEWEATIASFRAFQGDIEENDTGNIIQIFPYPDRGTWWIYADFRSHNHDENWGVGVLFIRRELVG